MAVCVFIGHRDILDDVYTNLRRAAEAVVEENDFVEFKLYYSMDAYFDLCLCAAARAKQCHPAKVTVTLLADQSQMEFCKQPSHYGVPDCLIERILPVTDPEPKARDIAQKVKAATRSLIGQAEYVVSYVYEDLYSVAGHYLRLARREGKKIIDVTSGETAQRILEGAEKLSERERAVFHAERSGMSQKAIAEQLGLSTNRTQQIIRGVEYGLKKYALKHAKTELLDRKVPVSCGIFCTGPATYESLTRFAYNLKYLVDCFHVREFRVESSLVLSGFMFALERQLGSLRVNYPHRIIVVTDTESDPLVLERLPVTADGAPLVDAVEEVPGEQGSGRWAIVSHIMEQSDFCICNLATAPGANHIRAYVPNTPKAVLMDFGREPSDAQNS